MHLSMFSTNKFVLYKSKTHRSKLPGPSKISRLPTPGVSSKLKPVKYEGKRDNLQGRKDNIHANPLNNDDFKQPQAPVTKMKSIQIKHTGL